MALGCSCSGWVTAGLSTGVHDDLDFGSNLYHLVCLKVDSEKFVCLPPGPWYYSFVNSYITFPGKGSSQKPGHVLEINTKENSLWG